MNVTIEKPLPSNSDHSRAMRPGEGFGRGERLIMVDGERWGRTRCEGHGVWGVSHLFFQDDGNSTQPITEGEIGRTAHVRSQSKRHQWRYATEANPNAQPTPTFDLVLAKARELIEAGKLRSPKDVRADRDKKRDELQRERNALDLQEARAFRERAIKALGLDHDNKSYMIDDVVEAMRWAQTQ